LSALPLEERPARWADNILSESKQMKDLVEEMLTLARADNMTHAPALSEVSFSDVAEDCALAFEPVAFEAGKPLEYTVAESTAVLGDGVRLRRL
ncbi:HAMP domain-containing sensor histidine kinase, partial [Klebsiella pneumoniae]|uniref:sensor histidine kinase n=1 Tax=Klebsiella pneumoniae TaxID=573 RepID=UPI00200FE194